MGVEKSSSSSDPSLDGNIEDNQTHSHVNINSKAFDGGGIWKMPVSVSAIHLSSPSPSVLDLAAASASPQLLDLLYRAEMDHIVKEILQQATEC